MIFFSLCGDVGHISITLIFKTVKIKFAFFHFYFLNMDILLNINIASFKLSICVENILLEKTVSLFPYMHQFLFYDKKRVTFGKFT